MHKISFTIYTHIFEDAGIKSEYFLWNKMIPVNRCCLSSLYLICSQSSPIITNDTDHCTPCMWRGPGPGPDWAVQVPGVVWASARCVPTIRRLHRTLQCWAPQPSHEVPWLLRGTVACLLWLLLLTYPVIQRYIYLLYSLLLYNIKNIWFILYFYDQFSLEKLYDK